MVYKSDSIERSNQPILRKNWPQKWRLLTPKTTTAPTLLRRMEARRVIVDDLSDEAKAEITMVGGKLTNVPTDSSYKSQLRFCPIWLMMEPILS